MMSSLTLQGVARACVATPQRKAATVIAVMAVATATVPVALGVAGFGSSGVLAGSAAAAWQGAVGDVAAGSAFALAQSVGAGKSAILLKAACACAGVSPLVAFLPPLRSK